MKKSNEIEKKMMVYEDEIIEYYDKMKNKIKAKALVFANEKSARKLLDYVGDVAERAKAEPEKFLLLYAIPSKWYILGEDNSSLENSIFNISIGRNREVIKINGKAALIIIEERAPNELEPLSEVRDEIVSGIKMRKERELMNEWIDGLRSKARIKIDEKVLNDLQ